MTRPVELPSVMDTSARAIALLSDEMYDQGKPRIAESWSTHLVAHDKARDAVAELIESLDAYLDDSSLDNRMNLIDSRNRIAGRKSPARDRELPRVGGAS